MSPQPSWRGALVLIVSALTGGGPGPGGGQPDGAISGEETSSETVSTGPSRVQTPEPTPVAAIPSRDEAFLEEEDEVVLTDALGGPAIDPTVAELFPDLARVLGKDDILPIYNPILVTARESGLEDGDHVMGLAIGGEARAYPVRELFSREMVNDEVAGVPVLVTW